MSFNSLTFIYFFIIVASCIYSNKAKYKSIILLIASYYFYSQAGLSSVFYLVSITSITYIAIGFTNKYNKKSVCLIGIILILLLLITSKYSELPDTINKITSFTAEKSLFIIPIGISFYSLQAISLLLDYRTDRFSSRPTLKETALFISFFPLSLAGPIHRAQELIPQFQETKSLNTDDIVIGIKTILLGFFCKLIIADKLAIIIDPVFNDIQIHYGLLICIATLLYCFQIYFDFWGYSLIALGIGKCLGYTIRINFKNPYSALSIKDFWNRWHISLSQWMRDYIYIPIGGNKNGYATFLFGIFLTFLISGIWHGASLNFILWGIVNILIFIIDDTITKLLKLNKNNYFRRILFLLLIPFTWLIFRTETLNELNYAIKRIFNFGNWGIVTTISYLKTDSNFIYLVMCTILIPIAQSNFIKSRINNLPISNKEKIYDSLFFIIGLLLIILFGDIGTQQFLYFNF